MNKVHREKAAKSFAAYGQEFAPKLIQEDDDFFIMDWRDKNGSGNMATRYILDKKKGTLIITGDSGNCIATWHSRKKPEEIARYLNDEQYFIEKMQCTEYKYDYDWDDVEADLKELEEEYLGYVREGGFKDNYGKEITEEDCIEDFEEMRSLLGEIRLAEESNYPKDLIELFEKYNTDWWEGGFSHIGQRVSFRIYQWIYGFQMGLEILKNKEEDAIIQLKQQPCEDCINRAEAIKETEKLLRGNYDAEYIVETLKTLPPVTPKALEQQPCEDAISRQAAQAKIKNICDEYRLSYEDGERKAATGGSAYALGHAFDDLPSVTPQPKIGHWITDVDRWGDIVTTVNGYRCSECNAFNADRDNYCPNCGAKMQEVEG